MDDQKLQALDTYFQLMTMNGGAHVFHTAHKLGLLQTLHQLGPATAESIAEACKLDSGATALFLDCLVGLGLLLRQDDDSYCLSPVCQLLAGSYSSLSNQYWAHLGTFLKTGEPMAQMDTVENSEEAYRHQVSALDWMMAPSAMAAARALGITSDRKGLRILDVGAGSGVWSLTFARLDPTAQVTANDWPAVLEITQGKAEEHGLTDRLSVLPGNYHEVDFPQAAFDLVILGNITHLETPEANVSLLSRLKGALVPGGELLIVDVFPDHPKGQLPAALYALGLGLRTAHGRVYDREELTAMLGETGYCVTDTHDLNVPPNTMGIVLSKLI